MTWTPSPALPSLPGYAAKVTPQAKIPTRFRFVNGLPIEKTTDDPSASHDLREGVPHGLKSGASQCPLVQPNSAQANHHIQHPQGAPTLDAFHGMRHQTLNRSIYDDPKSSHSKPMPFRGGVPAKAKFLTATQILKFQAYITERVSESPDESLRVRHLDVYYYCEDDTVHIEETKQANSGLPQGKFLARQKLQQDNSGSPITLDGLVIGRTLQVLGRDMVLVNCDESTRKTLLSLGYPPQPQALPYPRGEYDAIYDTAAKLRGGQDGSHYGKQLTSMKYFMEAHLGQVMQHHSEKGYRADGNQILRFAAVWDDRKSLYGDVSFFTLLFYLYDRTVEIIEVKTPNSGKGEFPVLLGRSRLPKNHEGEIYNDLDRGVEERNPHGHYYEELDLKIGNVLNVWGREMKIVDCDPFTKRYYQDKYTMSNDAFDPVVVSKTPRRTFERIPPPHVTGFGSEEDSLASWLHLHPKKPYRDIAKMQKYDGKMLQFLAQPLNGPSVKLGRTFAFKFYLSDDTIGVYDIPIRNSGIAPGCFLRRVKYQRPLSSKYYTAEDMNVGAEITLQSNVFRLIYADEYTRHFIQGTPEIIPEHDIKVINASMSKILQEKRKSMGFLREAFRYVDEDSDGLITLPELKKYLQNSCCHGGKVNDVTALKVFKSLDKDQNGVVDFNDFCKALGNEKGEIMHQEPFAVLSCSTEDVRPYLQTLGRAQASDPSSFDKLLSRNIPSNDTAFDVKMFYAALLQMKEKFSLVLELQDIQRTIGYLFPDGKGTVTKKELYSLLDRVLH